jgi:hypothetical protein
MNWRWSRFVSEFLQDFPLQILIPTLLHNHVSLPSDTRDIPEQTAHFYTAGVKIYPIQQFAACKVGPRTGAEGPEGE